jgi:hypothetical protein
VTKKGKSSREILVVTKKGKTSSLRANIGSVHLRSCLDFLTRQLRESLARHFQGRIDFSMVYFPSSLFDMSEEFGFSKSGIA